MRLADPWWLAVLILAPLPWLWERRRSRVAWPTLAGFEAGPAWPARLLRSLPAWTRGLAIACLALAMARPQVVGGRVHVAGRGVTIVAALDRSSTMKGADFPAEGGPITRLEAAKRVLSRFIEGRGDDLIGVVQFANYPDLVAAPTLDQRFLLDAVRSIRPAGIVDDGTSLGDALVVALGAARRSPSRRKVVVLLTDGRNAPAVPRPIAPLAAAEIARGLGVRLHTIAIGRPAEPPTPKPGATAGPTEAIASGPDVELLRRIAEVGGGRSFVAADADMLGHVFDEIDDLERSPVSGTIRTIYRERYAPWAAAALAALAVDLLLLSGRLRRLP